MAEMDEIDRLIGRAEKGDAYAQYRLAKRCLAGDGVEKSAQSALKLMRMAADNDNPYAAYEAAKMYRDGIGTEPNEFQTDAYFYKARTGFEFLESQTNDSRVQYRLGVMALHGEGRDVNIHDAVDYLTAAAWQDNPYAQYELAKLNLDAGVSMDAATAYDLMVRAAAHGHVGAQYLLGCTLTHSGNRANIAAGRKYLQQAAQASRSAAARLKAMDAPSPGSPRKGSERKSVIQNLRTSQGRASQDRAPAGPQPQRVRACAAR